MSQKVCNILVHNSLQSIHQMTKTIQGMKIPAVVGSIIVVGVLIY